MPRLTPSQIQQINNHSDLVALIRSRGIVLQKQVGSACLQGTCPFHDHRRQMLSVDPAKQRFTCPACGARGSALQFLQLFDGLSERHAYEVLNAGQRAYQCAPETPCRKSSITRLPALCRPDAPLPEILAGVVHYYHGRLMTTPGALDFMAKLGITDTAALRQLQIGFADRTLGLHLPSRNRVGGAILRKRLAEAGILRNTGHEHLNGAIVVPTLVPEGTDDQYRVAALYGYKLCRKAKARSGREHYLGGDGGGIWNQDALKRADRHLILCNAPLDALLFWGNGCRNATFNQGGRGMTSAMLQFLSVCVAHNRTLRIYLAYTNSENDNLYLHRDAEQIKALGVDVYQCLWPRAISLRQYIQNKKGHAADQLQGILERAHWIDINPARTGHQSTPLSCPSPLDKPPRVPLATVDTAHPCSIQPDHSGETRNESRSLSIDARQDTPNPSPQPLQETAGNAYCIMIDTRQYHMKLLRPAYANGIWKVTLTLKTGSYIHVDQLDLARDTERRRFADRAAEETGITVPQIRRDLGRLLLVLEKKHLPPPNDIAPPPQATLPRDLTGSQHAEALALLQNPDLVEIISSACQHSGLVGEHDNRLGAYLACTSRLLDRPLAVIIQSSSAAGKTTLMDTILRMMPAEACVKYSAMTGQSLYYFGETDLRHKILAIAEEQGIQKASYPLKLLQSEGNVAIATTGKDQRTGRIRTQPYHVKGPVMIFMTTTSPDIDDELLSRCLVLRVDESPEQTARIHARQRQERTMQGFLCKQQHNHLLTVLQNAQRLLKPLVVINPWAEELTFGSTALAARRDHHKYLTLIDTIALLHQYQRDRSPMPEDGSQKSDLGSPRSEIGAYITVTREDIALANRLAPALLGQPERRIAPQTRRVLETIRQCVCHGTSDGTSAAGTFTRRTIRDLLGWSTTQTRMHIERLRSSGFIHLQQNHPGQPVQYQLLSHPLPPSKALGLVDVATLKTPGGTTGSLSGCRGVSHLTPTPLNA